MSREATIRQIRQMRALGLARPRRRAPRPTPPTGIQLDYWRDIARLVAQARDLALRELEFLRPILDRPRRDGVRMDDERVNRAIDRASEAFFQALQQRDLERMARTAAERVQRLTRENLAKQARAQLGVDVFAAEPRLEGVVPGFVAENVALIKSVPNRFLDEVERLAANAIREGRRWEDLARDIEARTGVAEDRARLVARDQVGKLLGQITDARHAALGVTKFVWRTVNDNRVRPEHEEIAGETFEVGVGHPEEGIPGEAINCFPGDTRISTAALVNKLYRRRYSDELTELVTDQGRTLRGTRNHPVLTRRGWIPLHLVDVGDDVLQAPDEIRKVFVENQEGAETRFVQLFDAAKIVWGSRFAESRTARFHGDVSDDDVEIVDVDGNLPVELDSALFEKLAEYLLSFADEPTLSASPLLALLGTTSFPANRIVRGAGKFLALLLGESGVANEHCVGSTSWREALTDQFGADRGSRYAERLRHILDTVPGGVEGRQLLARVVFCVARRAIVESSGALPPSAEELAEIIRVAEEPCGDLGNRQGLQQFARVVEKRNGVFSSSGHVYNLENACSWYIAENSVVHNCRCFEEPDLSSIFAEAAAS